MSFLKIAGAVFSLILTVVCGSFAAGHGLEAYADPNVGDAVVTTAFGTGTLGFGALTAYLVGWLPRILGFLPSLTRGNVPLEISEAVAALLELAKRPKDWAARKKALEEVLEAAFAIAREEIEDPELDEILKRADEKVRKYFDQNAPKTLAGELKPAGQLTFAEAASK